MTKDYNIGHILFFGNQYYQITKFQILNIFTKICCLLRQATHFVAKNQDYEFRIVWWDQGARGKIPILFFSQRMFKNGLIAFLVGSNSEV